MSPGLLLIALSRPSTRTLPTMSVETDFVGNASADSAGEVIEDAPRPASSEGCPSPLGWAEVLESVRRRKHGLVDRRRGRRITRTDARPGPTALFLERHLGQLRTVLPAGVVAARRFSLRPVRLSQLTTASGAADRHDSASSDSSTISWPSPMLNTIKLSDVFAAPFGSLIALGALAEHPTRIERAVLLGGFAHRRLSRFERFLCGAGRFLPGTDFPSSAARHAANGQPSTRLSAVRREPLGVLRAEYGPDADPRSGGAGRLMATHRPARSVVANRAAGPLNSHGTRRSRLVRRAGRTRARRSRESASKTCPWPGNWLT